MEILIDHNQDIAAGDLDGLINGTGKSEIFFVTEDSGADRLLGDFKSFIGGRIVNDESFEGNPVCGGSKTAQGFVKPWCTIIGWDEDRDCGLDRGIHEGKLDCTTLN